MQVRNAVQSCVTSQRSWTTESANAQHSWCRRSNCLRNCILRHMVKRCTALQTVLKSTIGTMKRIAGTGANARIACETALNILRRDHEMHCRDRRSVGHCYSYVVSTLSAFSILLQSCINLNPPNALHSTNASFRRFRSTGRSFTEGAECMRTGDFADFHF